MNNPEYKELQKKVNSEKNEILRFICGHCSEPEKDTKAYICDRCPIEMMLDAYTGMAKELGGFEELIQIKKVLSERMQ